MKKLSSVLLSLLIVLSVFSFPVTSYAAKAHIEDKLVELEKREGFIPLKDASVQYNCFGFICDVCQKLYGTTYYYEQQKGNYQFNHTDSYFTVATRTFGYTDSMTKRSEYAKQIKNWLLDNAAPGDIIQYGSKDPNYSKKHTVLLQHIDSECFKVIHSNYETNNIPASAVRLDTIYWDSFIKTPSSNEYHGEELYSLNLLFGSSMKLTQGFGVSINRYSDPKNEFYVDSYMRFKPEIIKTERKSCTSINIKWKKIDGASEYRLEYMPKGGKWTAVSSTITGTDYTVTGLTVPTIYYFRVRALAGGEWHEYSDKVAKSARPPKVGKVTLAQVPEGISISFNTRSDINGVVIKRSENPSEGYTAIKWLNNSTSSFVDTSVEYGKTYYYVVYRYLKVNGTPQFSEISNAVSIAYTLAVPEGFKAENVSPTKIKLSWNPVTNAQFYRVKYKDTVTNATKTVDVTETSVTLAELTTGTKYKLYVKACSSVGSSSYTKRIKKIAKPKKTEITSITSTKSTVTLKWKKLSGVSGYRIYRREGKSGEFKLVKTVKGKNNLTYTNKKLKSDTKYYYVVKGYKTVNKVKVEGVSSTKKSVRTK